jgi:AmiR/NasT family two-component response regulator
MERDNLNRAVAARHRVGLAQGVLMTRRQLTADQAFTLLKRQSQNTNVEATNHCSNGHPDRRSAVGAEREAR